MISPQCLPILIGSLPLTSHAEAAELILKYTPEIPLWPQLPKNQGEGMVRQFLTGFPGLVDEGKKFWIDTTAEGFPGEMASFYEELMQAENDNNFLRTSRFSLGSDTARGFGALLEALAAARTELFSVKGQVTGPITTGIGAKDQDGNSIFYDDNLRDMLVKHLALTARWQVLELQRATQTATPIIFIDEPAMVSFGSSAFTGITREMATDSVGEVILGIQGGGGLAGVHICANGDWGPALDSGADIISFDAYSYFENFILFKPQLIAFLQRGGLLAWGIIPTGDPESVTKESANSLYRMLREQLLQLCTFGFSERQILEQTFIAPACGTGSLTLELAKKVLSMNSEVSQLCREYLQTID